MHSAIEHAKKRTSIFTSDQWDTIFHKAHRNNPYTVIPMRFNTFYDLKRFSTANFKNFKTDTKGMKVNWLKVLRVNKDNPDQIQVKYTLLAQISNQLMLPGLQEVVHHVHLNFQGNMKPKFQSQTQRKKTL